MSGWFRIPNSLVDDGTIAEIGAYGLAVLVVLLRHANQDGVSYPSRRRIRELTRLGNTTITQALRNLESAGLIEQKNDGRHGFGKSVYTLRMFLRREHENGAHVPVGERACSRKRHAHVPNRGTEEDIKKKTKEQDAATENGKPRKQAKEFDSFWQAYPTRNGRKAGSRTEALAAWAKLTPADREAALTSVPHYADASNGYPKDACRFLKNRLFVDYQQPEEIDPDDMVVETPEDFDRVASLKIQKMFEAKHGKRKPDTE